MPAERAYFRIRYPLTARPNFFVEGVRTKVLDVAEYGISFQADPLPGLEEGRRLAGRLQIDDRHTLHIEGDVVWITEGLAAIRLLEPIPYKVILDEQLHLRTRYPGR